MSQTTALGPQEHGYLRKNDDGSWTAVAVVQERVSDGSQPTYTVLPDEMPAFAQTMVNGCLRVEHNVDTFPVGRIDNAWASYQTTDASGAVVDSSVPQRMMAELRLVPNNPIATYVVDQVLQGNMQGVSLGMDAKHVETANGEFGRELTFKELSVVFESDVPGSRLLPMTNKKTGTVYDAAGAIPQTVSVCASGSKPWRIPPLNPKTQSTTWVRKTASDSKTVLRGSLTFQLTASASNKPLTYISMATPTSTTAAATPTTTATPVADAQLQAKYDELAVQLAQMKDAETVRVFWEKYGAALRALNTGASPDDSDVLTQAIANPSSVLEESSAAILRGMAMGYDRANQLSAGSKRPAEDSVSVAGSNDKRARLSDAEGALRARFGQQAATDSSGTDFKQAWNHRVQQQQTGPSVVDPVTGMFVNAPTKTAHDQKFDLDWLITMAVAPDTFAIPGDVNLVASAVAADAAGTVQRCAKDYAVSIYNGQTIRRAPSTSTVAPPDINDRNTYNLIASAGGFIL